MFSKDKKIELMSSHINNKQIEKLLPIITSTYNYDKYQEKLDYLNSWKIRKLIGYILLSVSFPLFQFKYNFNITILILSYGIGVVLTYKLLVMHYLNKQRKILKMYHNSKDYQLDKWNGNLKFHTKHWDNVKNIYIKCQNDVTLIMFLSDIESILEQKIKQWDTKTKIYSASGITIAQPYRRSPSMNYIYSEIDSAFQELTENNSILLHKLES